MLGRTFHQIKYTTTSQHTTNTITYGINTLLFIPNVFDFKQFIQTVGSNEKIETFTTTVELA